MEHQQIVIQDEVAQIQQLARSNKLIALNYTPGKALTVSVLNPSRPMTQLDVDLERADAIPQLIATKLTLQSVCTLNHAFA